MGGPDCDLKNVCASDSDDSDKLRSLQGSEDERRSKRSLNIISQEGDIPLINLELGQEFSNPNEFRNYIRTESFVKKYNLEWKKNVGNRIRVICADDKCEWKCFGS